MIDLTALTDDELRIMAAEAMGWKPSRHRTQWVHPNNRASCYYLSGLPDPLHDLNDAERLARHHGEPWSMQSWMLKDGSWRYRARVGGDLSETCISPARALTMAVLEALEEKKAKI